MGKVKGREKVYFQLAAFLRQKKNEEEWSDNKAKNVLNVSDN